MEEWKKQLNQINDRKTHKVSLNYALEAFLTSDYADDKTKRTDVFLLFSHIKKIL